MTQSGSSSRSQASPAELSAEKSALLVRAAELLHRYGTPSHRLEGVMKRVSQAVGIDAEYLYTPTSLFISFRHDQYRAQLLRVDAGPIDLGKLSDFHDALERFEHRSCPVSESRAEFEQIENRPPRFGGVLVTLATGLASACMAVFLNGGWSEIGIAFLLGLFVHAVQLLLGLLFPGERLFEFIAGFSCAMLAMLTSRFLLPIDDRIVTLASIVVILPGLSVTIAMTELAQRHLSSGVSRLTGAAVVFMTLAVGVALAWRLGESWRPENPPVAAVPSLIRYLALFLAPLCFMILFQARPMDCLKICFVAWVGFVSASLVQPIYGAEWGAFIGAAVIGTISNLYARFYKRPALIVQMPAILLLVPGSLGYLSVTSFIDRQGVAGIESAFAMMLVAMALAAGLITANALVAPKRFL
jgi:uncharacterized membrane protein YjjP (DUF1212 family)